MQQAAVPLPGEGAHIGLLSERELFRALPGIRSVKCGVASLFVRGQGAALSVNENCDATVRSDMEQALARIVPGGKQPGAADARSLLLSPSLTLPVTSGALSFGTWQGVYLARLRPDATGELVVTVAAGESTQADFTFNAGRRCGHPIDEEVGCARVRSSKRTCLSSREESGDAADTILVHEKHTSASLSLAAADLEPAMRAVVPESWNDEFFQHTYEGPDDMPGHVKSTLLGCSVAVPSAGGSPALGGQQRIQLNEHRDVGGWGCGHSRRVQVTEVPGGVRRALEVPAGGELEEVTDAVRQAVREALPAAGGGPGLAHLFAPDALAAVVVAGGDAARGLARALGWLTADAGARAAIAKNGPMVPVDASGELMLADGQGVWLYDAARGGGGAAEEEDAPAARRLTVTVHGARSA